MGKNIQRRINKKRKKINKNSKNSFYFIPTKGTQMKTLLTKGLEMSDKPESMSNLPLEIVGMIMDKVSDAKTFGSLLLSNSMFISSISEKILENIRERLNPVLTFEEDGYTICCQCVLLPIKRKHETLFQNVIEHNQCCYLPNGIYLKYKKTMLVTEINYFKGKKHGVSRLYNVNTGAKLSNYIFENDVQIAKNFKEPQCSESGFGTNNNLYARVGDRKISTKFSRSRILKKKKNNDAVLVEEEKMLIEEEKMLIEEEKMLVEEEKMLVEEEKMLIEEEKMLIEEEKIHDTKRLCNAKTRKGLQCKNKKIKGSIFCCKHGR